MQLSLLIGKQILTPEGERLGYITGAYLDRSMQKPTALTFADENEEEFFLPMRAVLAVGDAVIAKNIRLSAPTGIPSPVGLPAFSSEGEALGTVSDCLLGETHVLVLTKDGQAVSVPADCVLVGETAIVYPSPAARNAVKPKRKERPAKTEATPSPSDHREEPKHEEPKHEEPFRCNLLGRRVKKSVFDGDGVPVALAGERITPAILSLARRKNLLLTLTVNTLTNLL